MTLRLTILGCGTSGGTPRIGGDWGACDPANPKNRRLRCSLLAERIGEAGVTRVLVDTSPDMRAQLLAAGVDRVDAVFYTHDHADHVHGIDDLRVLAFNARKRVDVHADPATLACLRRRFDYCFVTPPGSAYPPILDPHELTPGRGVTIAGAGGKLTLTPFRQRHGDADSLGFRIGGAAYSSDANGFYDTSLALLEGLDVWIVDALRPKPHPSHLSLSEALAWIGRMKPRRAVLTHMHVDLDYDALSRELPDGVEPAYDGLRIELPYTD
jgi:phosphoribosyl 1,2-cyclic phosphate phosphodiesterase